MPVRPDPARLAPWLGSHGSRPVTTRAAACARTHQAALIIHPRHHRGGQPWWTTLRRRPSNEWLGIKDAAGLLNFRIGAWHDFGYANPPAPSCKTIPPLAARRGDQGRARRDRGNRWDLRR